MLSAFPRTLKILTNQLYEFVGITGLQAYAIEYKRKSTAISKKQCKLLKSARVDKSE